MEGAVKKLGPHRSYFHFSLAKSAQLIYKSVVGHNLRLITMRSQFHLSSTAHLYVIIPTSIRQYPFCHMLEISGACKISCRSTEGAIARRGYFKPAHNIANWARNVINGCPSEEFRRKVGVQQRIDLAFFSYDE